MTLKEKVNISEAELEIMKLLWENDLPMNSSEICEKKADKGWKITTVSTLLSRLTEKKAVTYEKRGKFYYYSSILDQNDYKLKQTKNFLQKIYGGSVKNLVAALYENEELTEGDIEELQALFQSTRRE